MKNYASRENWDSRAWWISTQEFTSLINQALDECAPFKQFKVKHNFKPGITEAAKKLIKERDETKKKIAGAKLSEKPLLDLRSYEWRGNSAGSENQAHRSMEVGQKWGMSITAW